MNRSPLSPALPPRVAGGEGGDNTGRDRFIGRRSGKDEFVLSVSSEMLPWGALTCALRGADRAHGVMEGQAQDLDKEVNGLAGYWPDPGFFRCRMDYEEYTKPVDTKALREYVSAVTGTRAQPQPVALATAL